MTPYEEICLFFDSSYDISYIATNILYEYFKTNKTSNGVLYHGWPLNVNVVGSIHVVFYHSTSLF